MKKVICALTVAVLCSCGSARAQWVAYLFETDQHLDSLCTGVGGNLADGTEIRIYHDWNSNGPDAADTLIGVCDDPPNCDAGPVGTVGFNTFPLNGMTCNPQFAGGFNTQYPPIENAVVSSGAAPTPNRVYLDVCFGGRHYESEILSPADGYSEIEINTWTCVEAPCPGCDTPPTPVGFRASDSTSCTGVAMHWHFTGSLDANVDSVFLYREAQLIGRVHASLTDTTFVDTTAPDAQPYNYSAKSRRACVGGNFAYSGFVFDLGAKYPSPPNITFSGAPYGATDDSCNEVRVSWTYNTNSGVDSFIIQRNGLRVGAVVKRTPTPGVMSFFDVTTDPTHGGYRVCGWNPVCGVSNCSVVDTGWAKQPPQVAPTGINATDGLCNTTRVSWNTLSGATGYKVYRNSEAGCTGTDVQLGTVTAPDTFYNDNSGAFGTVYGYKVAAANTCGEGPKSGCDNGYRVQTPAQPSAFLASDGTSCDTVTLTWNNVAQEVGYKVSRRKLSTGVLDTFLIAADTLHYFDLSAVPGDTYYYHVRSYNACGNSAISSGDSLGYRLAIPLQVQNVQATDSTQCARVTITWNNLAYEDSFQVRRSGNRIGSTLANVLTYQDSTGSLDSIYDYRVTAYNRCGVGTESASNPGNRRRRPGLVTGVAASDTGCTVIHLSWNTLANTDSFRIYRNGVYLTRVTGATTAYNDNPAVGTYAYRILPLNTCGLGDTSAVDSGTRRPSTSQVSGLYATDGQCFETIVGWHRMSGVDSFVVRRNGVRLGRALGTDSVYSDATGSPGIRYAYTVIVYDPCGPGPVSPPDSGWQLVSPARPTGLAGTQELCDRVILTWQDVSFESSYIVRRNNSIIGFVAADSTSFTDHPPTGSYSYTVQAINECGASQTSSPATGTRAGPPSIVLQTAAEECPHIILSWTHSANSDWVRVFRDALLVDSVQCPSSQYVDTSMSAGVHSYFVMAVNQCGFFLSDTLFAEAVQMPQPPDSVAFTNNHCDRITLTWTYAGGVFSHYRIYRDGSIYGSVPSNLTAYADTNVVGGETYRYRLSAVSDTCGESGLTEEILAALTNIPQPSSPTVVVSIVDQDARLTWNHVTTSDSGCPVTVTGYLVFYAPTATGPFYYHGFTSDTTYTHVRVVHYNFGMYYQVLSSTEPLTLLQQLPTEATLEETMHLLRVGIRSR